MRSFVFKSYVIFFRYTGPETHTDVFEVVDILEEHRDFIAYFQDDPDDPEDT